MRCVACRDLLDRHLTIHEPRCDSLQKSRKRKFRAAKACDWCVVAKTKCSDERPCTRCKKRELRCSIAGGPTPPTSTTTTLTSAFNEPRNSTLPSSNALEITEQGEEIDASTNLLDDEDSFRIEEASISPQAGDANDQPSLVRPQPSTETTQTAQEWNTSAMNEAPYFSEIDFVFDFNDDDLFAMDLDWNALVEPSFISNERFEVFDNIHVTGEKTPVVSRAPHALRAMLGHEAFKRSPWLWQADSRESAAAEEAPQLSEAQEQVLLPQVILDSASVASMQTPPSLSNSARDSILLLVQRYSGPTTTVQSFPSARTLSLLLMNFVSREKDEGYSFVHMPSLNLDNCRTELLTAMIAAGSMPVGINQIWKLGLALQEKTRMALFRALDGDNSIARTLHIIQASLLWIETGLWCGSSRKMEVAESAANNVSTVCCTLRYPL